MINDIDLNEITCSIIEHVDHFICKTDNGQCIPTFTTDLGGRTIFTRLPVLDGDKYTYNETSQYIKFSDTCFMPLPWHISTSEFYARLSRFIKRAPKSMNKQLLQCYPDYALKIIDTVFCPTPTTLLSKDAALSIIDAIEDESADDDLVIDAKIKLTKSGVTQIPPLPIYHSQYHRIVTRDGKSGTDLRVLTHGWIINNEVVIKSEVEYI